MNSTYPIETSIPTSGLGRRIRSAIARLTSSGRRELTREELAQLRENQLLADRILDDARTSAYAARLL
jgi:hypothetical protein